MKRPKQKCYGQNVCKVYIRKVDALAKLGRPAPEISPHLKHIIVTAMFNGFFEMIIHNMPPKEAESYLRELHLFFEAGWAKIMGQ